MKLIEVEALPAAEIDRVVIVARGEGDPLAPDEPVVLHTAGGEYFSGRVSSSESDLRTAYRIDVLGRLPEDLALRRLGRVVDLSPAARREAASLQELADLLGAARKALAEPPAVPAQGSGPSSREPRALPTG